MESVGTQWGPVGAAPASFCVCGAGAGTALRRNWGALPWGGGCLAGWCWCGGVGGGLESRWGVSWDSVPLTAGFASEIAASVQEKCFLHLESPICRVCGLDTPYPLAHEKEYMPDHLKTFEAIKRTVNF